MSDAVDGPVETVARRVAELRARKGWTATQLGEQLKAVGISWDRFTVASLENGKRQSVSVTELLALARILDVAPVHLLVPVDDRRFRVTPVETRDATRVRAWLRGEQPLPSADLRTYFGEAPVDEIRPVRTVRFGGRHGSEELQEWADKDARRAQEREERTEDD